MNIIGHKNIFLTISAILTVAAAAALLGFGFHQGIDFSGGTLWQFQIAAAPPRVIELTDFLQKNLQLTDARINFDAPNASYLLRLPSVSQADHQKFSDLLVSRYASFKELSFQTIGPSVGADLKNKSLIALGLVLLGISAYIAFAFRKVFRPISSWKYGVITLLTLFHDVIIPAGLLAILGRVAQVEIDGNFVVALLVVMGFSVHDTIVVFDRIRENLMLDRGKSNFGAVVNHSVNQTLGRSINTSLTLILVLFALLFIGPVPLRYFVLTLLVGVTTGIYSSIFVASPLLLVWQQIRQKR